MELLRTKPFSRITHTEITEGVAIDRSTVYRYYDHKNQVLQAAVDARLTAFASRLDPTFGRMETVDGYLGRLVDAWIGLWLESGPLPAAASGPGAEPGPERDRWRARVEPWTGAVREAVEVARFVEELPRDGRPARPLAEMAVNLCLATFTAELTVPHTEKHRARPAAGRGAAHPRPRLTGPGRRTAQARWRAMSPNAPTTAPRANIDASSSSMWTRPAGSSTR